MVKFKYVYNFIIANNLKIFYNSIDRVSVSQHWSIFQHFNLNIRLTSWLIKIRNCFVWLRSVIIVNSHLKVILTGSAKKVENLNLVIEIICEIV